MADKPAALYPNVPTLKQATGSNWATGAWRGIAAPKGLPADIVDKLNAATKKVLEDPGVKKRIEDTGSLIIGNTPEQFAQQIKDEFAVYQQVVAKQKLSL